MNVRNLVAAEPEDDNFGEIEVSEYIVFLFALDTYLRYLEEVSEGAVDDVADKGLKLLRLADTLHLDSFEKFVGGHLPKDTQKKMLSKALRTHPTPDGAARRALQIRTVLSRGGAGTMRGIFVTNKALQNVRTAISSSTIDDADSALDKFATISVKNSKIRTWVKLASDTAGSGYTPTPVAGAAGVSDDTRNLIKTRITESGSTMTSEEGAQARHQGDSILQKVQAVATSSAKSTLVAREEEDLPPKKSEVVGIATAAVVAAMSDPEDERNIPEALRKLDPEQRMAALTDGRVLVAAGAGAGKSTTLVARIKYLTTEKHVNPSRVLACSFNKKAADELKGKIAKSLGYNVKSTSGVQVGTMHSLFYKFICGDRQTPGYGTPEEKAMLKPPRLIAPPKEGLKDSQGGVKTISPIALTAAIRDIWDECSTDTLAGFVKGAPREWFEGDPPKSKKVNLILNAWRGNDVTLEQAKEIGKGSKAEAQAAVWYEFYLGVKGDIPGWRPPATSKSYTSFISRYRRGGERLGDLDDMLKVFRDILRRDPRAKKEIQGNIDHILVDEAQDSNTVQHQIFELMSEHVGPESKDKSIWMIGDEKQSIYQFRGAKPELFVGLHGKEGWKTRVISTNYRCEPEIVEAANRLASNNEGGIPMRAVANPQKTPGKASIEVETPPDNTTAAISTLNRIRKDMDEEGAQAEDYAVLTRTNAELNDFETACIINEVPYIRTGGKGFLEAPETKALLGYINLATGNDYEKLRKSLIAVLMKPDRNLFLGADDVEKAVDEAIDTVSRRERVDKKFFRPTMLLEPRYIGILADCLKQPYKLQLVGNAATPQKGEYSYKMRVEELTVNLKNLRSDLEDLRNLIENENIGTPQLLNYVLDNMSSEIGQYDKVTRVTTVTKTTLREQVSADLALFSSDDDVEEDDEDDGTLKGQVGEDGQMVHEDKDKGAAGLGAIQFLVALANPNKNDFSRNTDPSTSQGFVKKIERYSELADTLRIDAVAWEKEQAKIADESQRRSKPPAVTLSTVHSVKGAEWKNVTVMMPLGVFPLMRKPKPDEPPPDPEKEAERIKAERNLAYVAITRAAENLNIVCPDNKGVSPFVFEAGLKVGQNVPKGMGTEPTTKFSSDLDESHVEETLVKFAAAKVAVVDFDYLGGM